MIVLASMSQTHEVLNQPPPLVDYNLFETDPILTEALRREGGEWAQEKVKEFGRRVGSVEAIQWGFQANENPPVLHTHDRYGHRVDEVEFHPAWHNLMQLSIEFGLHNLPWREPRDGAHVARAAMMMIASQNEYGHLCPISMTYSIVPSLRKEPKIAKEWEPLLHSTTYDPRFLPTKQKKGMICGMAMTEKQGGSDVRANTTRAVPVSAGSVEYLITGHKWFCSAPMSDAFLVLAQAPGGLSCFFLPRWTPDGEKNRFFIQRLKDKLGNRSNASSEVEFEGAWAHRIGEEGRGVATIIEMVNHTRLDCVIGSAGGMRQAVVQALHHTRHRKAFGKFLIDQPLMQNVLTDLCIESEAATILMMRLARAFDQQKNKDQEGAFRRITSAVAKYWVCKRGPMHVAEALECLGGNGFVEEGIMPRLYREMPLNSIWEGSGNVIALDVVRALEKEPGTFEALQQEINLAKGADKRLDTFIDRLQKDRNELQSLTSVRRVVENLALALQGSLLVRFGHPAVADAFFASRLSGDWGHAFGTLPSKVDFQAILKRFSW